MVETVEQLKTDERTSVYPCIAFRPPELTEMSLDAGFTLCSKPIVACSLVRWLRAGKR